MGRPIVYLIGAGPGDPGLITVKGLACIAEADVIIYDYLANSKFLSHAREDAEVIYVGKKGFTQHVTQEEINAVIVEKALEDGGKTVARLKGGDPFIFGRGGEEALALVDAGIRFEVVPGISSGYAAPAYAGIPVTHRGITTDMAFVTGHEDPTKDSSDINWEGLATSVGTICFFMGIKNLPTITSRLIEFGRPATTPVALVRWGTTPRQEVLVGTLADIAGKAAAVNFKAPAITIVGEVVSLREQLAWFETRPLFGKTIVVTRSRAQASVLTDALEDLGAEVLEFPTIKIIDPEEWAPVDEAIRNLDIYDWLVLTSVNGVGRFFDRLEYADKDARALAGLRVSAIGPATAAACIERGVRPDYVPDEYRAEGILDGLCERGVGKDSKVLLARALEARDVLPDELRERGARVDVVTVYRTEVGEGDPRVLERLRDAEVDAVTFTSSSTVTNFIKLAEGIDLAAVLKDALVASIGPITSDTARAAGLTVGVEAEEYTIPGLVTAVAKHFGVDIDEEE
ncbi:MAG: uroporphyrinogen-III C-methyltransferase [Actinomycetota bacterium]|nr:MAG: uroporphyrinogen III methyltransferase [Actinomycetota bacterium]MDO8950786.1 uroporphyrinogen-III C-methyltransferase [Actinomycetota bacterium]MDP3629701.1 uroporphyrinogen-III C-methyltransferase [Actinomycetota bacterium]